MLKSLKSLFVKYFGIRMEVPCEGCEYRVTTLVPFKGHRTILHGWRTGSPAEVALSLALDSTAYCGEYVTIGGQRWKVWNRSVTPVDPAKRQFKGDRSRDRENRPNPCEAK